MKRYFLIFILLISNIMFGKTKVGVTMLPYYSYVSNIVGDKMEVVPLIPENANAHIYDATPQDIKRLEKVDIVVVNGIGNDEFVPSMLKAVKKNIKVINANKKTELMYISGQKNKKVINSHTYISATQSIQQINEIAHQLEKIDPANAKYYRANAMSYIAKIRNIKAEALRKVKDKSKNIKIATTHGAYDYLLNEFGMSVSVVVEPSYVQSPSIADIKQAISVIKEQDIKILFDEQTSSKKLADTIYKETGVYVAVLNHMTNGAYKKDAFEEKLKENLDVIVDAILKVGR